MVTYDPRYTGCPGCGAWDDVDCGCTGADYPRRVGFARYLRDLRECSCGAVDKVRGWHHDPGCVFYLVQGIFLREARLAKPFDFADWGDRGRIRYQHE